MTDPNSTDLSFEAMLQAQDVAMTPAQDLYPDPMDTSTSPTHFASLNTPIRPSTSTHLRPTIHPPTRPTPDAPMVHAEPQTPSLFQRFAEVFRPLPFIGNLFKLVPDSGYQLKEASVMSKGLDIFRWLFPSSSSGIDTTQALTDDMPLASMISACVDVEASFADPMTLSPPQICPEPPDVAPLPLPSPSDSSFDQLAHFLHDHVSDHLRSMQQAGTFTEVFATFIVGPPDHSNAGSSLHSHLVGCATTDPTTHHLALYVPTGAGQPYTGPSEWAPVMVHIAASLLWPDLPFLVTSADYILGAQATLSELQRCLGYPSAFSLFTTSHSLAGTDVLLHFPPPSTFSLIVPSLETTPLLSASGVLIKILPLPPPIPSLSAAVQPTLPMPPHMAPHLGIVTGTPDYLKAKVGEQVSRTLPNMNLCPSSFSVSLNTGQVVLKLDRAAFVDPVSGAFNILHSHYSPGIPAWSLPPHSLAHNLFAFLFTIFYGPDRLIEGFGAGAYSGAVAAAFLLKIGS